MKDKKKKEDNVVQCTENTDPSKVKLRSHIENSAFSGLDIPSQGLMSSQMSTAPHRPTVHLLGSSLLLTWLSF
jgi:hypothetical protein